ncbi:MAG: hypothetical protein KAW12_09645 [Candidatus Aminicenantes bacterium]|nr:hypothetical protein [Candidatus Aminicenantes bacterium]
MTKTIFISIIFLGFFISGYAGQEEQAGLESHLTGEHRFGVQFIWDGYGSCSIEKEAGVLKITGSQFSKDKQDYVSIAGTVKIINRREFIVTGSLKTNIKSCCGKVEKSGSFRFKRWGSRQFWRLQNPEREDFCDKYTCHYYIDIFVPLLQKKTRM